MSDPAGTREKILRVARSHFARNGYHGTSMDSIVKGTNLSKGAIYWHFNGKFELFAAVVEEEGQRVLKYLVPGPGDLDGGAPEFFVRRGEQYLEALWDDPEMRLIWLTLFLEAQRGGEEGRDLSLLADRLLRSTHEILRPVVMEAFPGLSRGCREMPLEDVMMIVDLFFDGMVMNLGLRVDLATARSYWRFVIHRFIDFEGEK